MPRDTKYREVTPPKRQLGPVKRFELVKIKRMTRSPDPFVNDVLREDFSSNKTIYTRMLELCRDSPDSDEVNEDKFNNLHAEIVKIIEGSKSDFGVDFQHEQNVQVAADRVRMYLISDMEVSDFDDTRGGKSTRSRKRRRTAKRRANKKRTTRKAAKRRHTKKRR